MGFTLATLGVLLLRAIGAIDSIVAFLRLLGVQIGSPAQSDQALQIIGFEQETNTNLALVIRQNQDTQVALAHIFSVLSNQVGSPQQSNKPVLLPKVPPPGYGGPSSSVIAHDVWAYVPPGETFATQGLLHFAGLFAQGFGVNGMYILRDSPYFAVEGDLEDGQTSIPNGDIPTFDRTLITSTDTLLTFLNANSGITGWSLGIDGAHYSAITPFVGSPGQYVCLLDEAEFAQIKAFQLGTLEVAAPVWPGVAHVTLGTALALSNGLTVPGPLDGVLVHITSVPYPVGFYPFGALKSYTKVGGIAFVDDNGQAELAQPLGFEQNVICPKSMTQAAHALIRLTTGVTGTVTPWILA